jgi:RNA polymerase sigma-70 factor (ECF subfamily)
MHSTKERIRAAIRGHDDAFYQLMQEHKEKLYRIALSYMKNENDALEAVQETTYRAYLKLHKLKEPDYFGTWLVRILLNYCIDELKSRNRTTTWFIHQQPDVAVSDEFNLKIERMGLDAAIRQMEPKYQQVVHLKYFKDLTISEIAHTLEKPEGTVKTWLHKALSGLRTHLDKDGEHHER